MKSARELHGISRRSVLRAGAISPLVPGLMGAQRWNILESVRPNFLFIHTDQQSLETISALGCDTVHTPNIDALIARGTAFRQSYCTDPVCSPARAGWYTGRPSSESGVVRNRRFLDDSIPDLGQWLRDAGYDAYYIGKWHIRGRSLAESFQLIVEKADIFGMNSDRVLSAAASSFLAQHRSRRPFLLNVGFVQPHDINFWFEKFAAAPHGVPANMRSDLPPLPPNFHFDLAEPKLFGRRRKQSVSRITETWTEDTWRMYLWVYLRYVEMVDAEVGRVLDALESSPHASNTVVIFSSDHGEGMAQHQLASKGFLYEAAMKVPLVISCPERFQKGVIDESHLVSGLDVFPTITDLAAILPPQRLAGRSLRPLLESGEAQAKPWRAFLAAEHNISGRMIRSDRYKLITYFGDETSLFFDVQADPFETENLVDVAAHGTALAAHRAYLQEREASLVRASDRTSDRDRTEGTNEHKQQD